MKHKNTFFENMIQIVLTQLQMASVSKCTRIVTQNVLTQNVQG